MDNYLVNDEAYERKFDEMQKYIPFLERVIEKMKCSDNDKPRKAQLEKMQTLHNLLNNKQKRLKIETMLKCESILKKLYAKIDKSEETDTNKNSNSPSLTSFEQRKDNITSASSGNSQATRNKFVANRNLIEIHTCPASPTQSFDEICGPPPVEIPTERLSPPRSNSVSSREHRSIRSFQDNSVKHIPSIVSTRVQSRSNEYNRYDNKYQEYSSSESSKSRHQRYSDYSDPKDRTGERTSAGTSRSTSSRSYPSSSSSSLSNPEPKRREHTKKYSSEEENWDEPEEDNWDEPKKLPKQTSKTSLRQESSSSSTSHNQYREVERNSSHHDGFYSRNQFHDAPPKLPPQLPPSFPPLPDINIEKDAFQKKLYHDTIYKFKKADPPSTKFHHFMNPPRPESPLPSPTGSNIFNRLGDKIDLHNLKNMRIEVQNDYINKKPPKPIFLPPPLRSVVPIDEVLKSPPLSADDIDDLLNESLEAATGKQFKTKPIELSKDRKQNALDLVRKKLALISKSPQPGIESPPCLDVDQSDSIPFYRRGHTPTRMVQEPVKLNEKDNFKPSTVIHTKIPDLSPPLPTNTVIERLALKYNPHPRRDSISGMPKESSNRNKSDKPDTQLHSINDKIVDPKMDRLALKYNPHPRKDSMASSGRTFDPRVGKVMAQPPLPNTTLISPPNILPAINLFDPRLKTGRQASVERLPQSQFCPQSYTSTIPCLLDMNVKNPLSPITAVPSKTPFGTPPSNRFDPRAQKHSPAVLNDKFNPERNDQTERMKYLESKKKKQPEPKTYAEYKQSKSRQRAEEAANSNQSTASCKFVSSSPLPAESTLDKMYRNADYGKELGGNINSFKIPKKVNAEDQAAQNKNCKDSKYDQSKAQDTKDIKSDKSKIQDSKELSKSIESKIQPTRIDQKLEKQETKADKICEKSTESEKEIEKISTKNNDLQSVGNNSSLEKGKRSKEQKTKQKEDEAELQKDEIQSSGKGSTSKTKIPIKSPEKLSETINGAEEPTTIEHDVVLEKKDDSKKQTETKVLKTQEEESPIEEVEKYIKPPRNTTRSTILEEDSKGKSIESRDTPSPQPRCRSSSDIFAPTNDNSIVSTQNIISGKRRTRTSINFNEKATKKPATPKASTPGENKRTQVATKQEKSTPISKKNKNGKQKDDDGQICAVSSTTSQGDGEDLHVPGSSINEEMLSPEEPSSSGSKQQTPTIDADENQKKQEWLEGFLKSMGDPSTNKDRILDMLKSVLDESKLEQVKNILYSPEDDTKEKSSDAKKTEEQSKPRVARQKKNELDRLNEDIRDMFICQGVVTATGRRMCTFAKQNPPKDQTKERRMTPKRQTPTPSMQNSLEKRRMRRAKVIISPLNMRALRSATKTESPLPKMPVLQPNTPVKLPQEEDDEEEEDTRCSKKKPNQKSVAKKNAGPRSKRQQPHKQDTGNDDYISNQTSEEEDEDDDQKDNNNIKKRPIRKSAAKILNKSGPKSKRTQPTDRTDQESDFDDDQSSQTSEEEDDEEKHKNNKKKQSQKPVAKNLRSKAGPKSRRAKPIDTESDEDDDQSSQTSEEEDDEEEHKNNKKKLSQKPVAKNLRNKSGPKSRRVKPIDTGSDEDDDRSSHTSEEEDDEEEHKSNKKKQSQKPVAKNLRNKSGPKSKRVKPIDTGSDEDDDQSSHTSEEEDDEEEHKSNKKKQSQKPVAKNLRNKSGPKSKRVKPIDTGSDEDDDQSSHTSEEEDDEEEHKSNKKKQSQKPVAKNLRNKSGPKSKRVKPSDTESDDQLSQTSEEGNNKCHKKKSDRKPLSKALRNRSGPKSKRVKQNDGDSDNNDEQSSQTSEEEEEKEKQKDSKKTDQKVFVKLLKSNTGPKSTAVEPIVLNSDEDDDDIQLAHLKMKIKEKNEVKIKIEMQNTEEESTDKNLTERKEDANKTNEVEKKSEQITKKEDKEMKPAKPVPKNTNKNWHTMSTYASTCVICEEKSRFIAPHYLMAHNNSEVYSSRLPPDVLEDIKKNIGNRALYMVVKKQTMTYHYRCPFCDFQATSAIRSWVDHFTIHTGEYQYKCSGCYRAMNGSSHMTEHIKRYCPQATKIMRETISFKSNTIVAFVCNLCNFLQMLRRNMIRHLEVHHEIKDDACCEYILEVKLIDTAKVPKMEECKDQTKSSEGKVNTAEVLEIEEKQKSIEEKQNAFEVSTTDENNCTKSSSEVVLAPPQAPEPTISKDSFPETNTNIDVFLSRELASPTVDVLTERLKSIDQDDGLVSDSSVNIVSPFKNGDGTPGRMTIAERLTQRFKNIGKQTLLEESQSETQRNISDASQNNYEAQKEINNTEETSTTNTLGLDKTNESIEKTATEENDRDNCYSEQKEDSSFEDDNCDESNSMDVNENEDDNDNWEDIEITEAKESSQKNKNKNTSMFKTLSRLYASIAPKKGLKRKEKKKVAEKKLDSGRETQTPTPFLSVAETPTTTDPSTSLVSVAEMPTATTTTTSFALTPEQTSQVSNLSELMPDSPTDSLDMLLGTTFNCLEGDSSSFPQLDLNDLDTPLFLLAEEQPNLQDAITMAIESNDRYDLLGNPIPPTICQSLSQSSPSSSVRRVGNFGFSSMGNTVKYYCMVKDCAFLFSDHPDGLQNHYLLEHSNLSWDGYCHTCEMQISNAGGREIQHMLETHSHIMSEDSTEKPRIKFRRLTGDILSTDKPKPPEIPLLCNEVSNNSPNLSLSTMLQSEPRAMFLRKEQPPNFEPDIPLFKNVSKEFAITNVSEAITDNSLFNLVLNQADSAPGGMQISQVISLNAGGKSVSPLPSALELTNITDLVSSEQRKTPVPEVQNSRCSIQDSNTFPQIKNAFSLLQSNQNIVEPKTKTNSSKGPMFKCSIKSCQFTTSLRSVMNEHLMFHLRTDNNRDCLRCYQCEFIGKHIPDYFQHMTKEHIVSVSSPKCSSSNDLTQKIQDILRTTSNPNSPKPLPSNPPEKEKEKEDSCESNLHQGLKVVAEEIVAVTGLSDQELWKCIFYPECSCTVTEEDFQTHLAKHIGLLSQEHPSISPGSSLYCPHCTANYYRAATLKSHMKSHGRHKYFCHICSCATFLNMQQTQKHFNDIHSSFDQLHTQSLFQNKNSDKSTVFVVSQNKLTSQELTQFGEKLMNDWERKKAVNKTHFKPHEQYLLPLQPIFNNQVFCSVCNYKTKVRTNMYRHLQLHKQEVEVASVDPVNPVPCLEKNEKHFDKMLNLACSSNATGATTKTKEATGSTKIPMFVSDLKRYVCGNPGCAYLTITDHMLRSHLNALHGSEKGYRCPHCQEDICKKNMCAERVVQHLKFHGSKIYQCGECEYLHYTKHVVERHVNEKHSTIPVVNLIVYDRSDSEVVKSTQLVTGRTLNLGGQLPSNESENNSSTGTSTTSSQSNKFKWECALCKHQTITWNQMISHANSSHNAKHQYQCVHCTFGSAHLSHIMDHIDTKHPAKIREAKYVFHKINETQQEKAADTRPLWLRDDPKRVRSIRGILMENEEDAERTKRNLSNSEVGSDDEDDIEITNVIESESSMKHGTLSCFHCNFTSKEMGTLTTHWKTKHWKLLANVPIVPFFFRIHTILKCPSCTFVGDHVSLKKHANTEHGQHVFCAADPKLLNTCGHCPFVFPPKRLDVLMSHYNREHKPTDVKNLSSSLLRNMLSLGECQVYMQCYFCAEICADKTSIIEHERERHNSSNFRYKQIKDEIIYRCGMCQYSSTNELATLRHMIDHFNGFKACHFCSNIQSNFNAYMQHCYTNHPKELTYFKELYTLENLSDFLGQMLLIFPNGLIVSKKNLVHTQYGSTERINAMYDEICKKALEPPIPPLSMGQLLAKKSIQASSRPLLPPPPVPFTAKRIAKRRSTVAMGAGDRASNDFLIPSGPQKIKKRKISISEDRPIPPAPLFSTITSSTIVEDNPVIPIKMDTVRSESETLGVSFYGKKSQPEDLSKIYTQIAIGDKYAPVSVKKFALLFKMNVKVVVDKIDLKKYQSKKKYITKSKPCPASKKKKLSYVQEN